MFERKKYIEVIAEGQAEKVEAAHDLIDEIMAKRVKIGEGKNAEVFFSSKGAKQDLCIKQLRQVSERPHYQSIDWEMKLQDEAHKLEVKVPQPILALITEDDQSFMVMETIKGKSLQDIAGQALNPPASYKHNEFWGKLEGMLARLHDNRIYHRDLHLGNIMVDFQSGEPVLIDFGWSAYVPGGDDPYREVNVNINHLEDFSNDDERLKRCKREFSQHLTEVSQ